MLRERIYQEIEKTGVKVVMASATLENVEIPATQIDSVKKESPSPINS